MIRARRDFGKLALALLPASTLLAKQDSRWGGVQVGINVPHSFKGVGQSGQDTGILKADRPERFGAAASARRGVVRRARGFMPLGSTCRKGVRRRYRAVELGMF